MTELENYNSDKIIAENLPELLKNNSIDHQIFFVTFTFENTKLPDEYINYTAFFKRIFEKINQSLLTSSRQSFGACKLILIPEKSNAHTNEIHFKNRHFHGFLFIRKSHLEKFTRKCVKEIIECPETKTETLILQEKIIYPFSKQKSLFARMLLDAPSRSKFKNLQTELLLKVFSYKIYPISTENDFIATSKYCGKNFFRHDLSDKDLIIFAKTPRQNPRHINRSEENYYQLN